MSFKGVARERGLLSADRTFSSCKTFAHGSIIRCVVGTTGDCGGEDEGDGYAFIEITQPEPESASMDVLIDGNHLEEKVRSIHISLVGDSDIKTLAEALEWGASSLKSLFTIQEGGVL